MTRITRSILITTAAALLVTGRGPAAADSGDQFQTTPTTFSGQARAVTGTILGVPIELVDTGPVEVEGGTLEQHLLCYPAGPGCTVGLPDLTGGTLSTQVLNATVVAQGNHSRARASVVDLNLNVAGQQIGATFVEANAHAQCADGQAFVRGDATVAELVINGETYQVTGDVNQRIPLPLGAGVVIINEQVAEAGGGKGDITVSALHIIIPAANTDVVIAQAHADIGCGQRFCPADKDFVTGGGWLPDPRRTFAVAGGIKNGGGWGHLLYINHGTRVRAKGTGVTNYMVTGPTSRRITGTCDINGTPGTYEVDIDDRGEPGAGHDVIAIRLSTGETAAGVLSGGNLQLHTCR